MEVLSIIGLFCLVCFLGFKLFNTQKELKAFSLSAANLRDELEKLEAKAAPFWKYQKIVDAQQAADSILAKAEARASEILDKSIVGLENAKQKAIGILKEAKAKAQEIAGEALEAKGKADIYESKAKAIKHLIEGYGNEYLISARTLLDDLAEEFSHKEGGVELSKARLFTKSLVTSSRAAVCDYTNSKRKDIAIRFVLDAFNGKVDTAVSKVKSDNYGKLEQEVKDAFGLVNGNGRAFRNARITQEYLDARLTELRWGCITQELKLQEREEQRQIKEAIREEEKARREYEKAIREVEKEERLIQQAMDKAKKQMEGASEDQRQKYEQQIAELQAKFEEAEAKNQRALSMAQQTRRGHVYVISNEGSFGENVYKIGLTRRLEPMDRVKELGDASVPFGFDVHAMIFAEDAPTLENELHQHFDDNRLNKVNTRKEFFRSQLKDIREIVEERGLETHWTMKAEAREYHETLALEKAQHENIEIQTEVAREQPEMAYV